MLEIRDIRTSQELTAVEGLQREVWGFSDLDIVSGPILRVLLEIGGVLIGAFDEANELIAFNSGFAGFRKGHAEVHSDMLAVREAYRDKGLGHKLKLVQRDRVLAMGMDRITWTFDPLRSRNAYFNFRKLGVVCDEYRVNFYGESTSSFLHSIGTDRLWVTWFLHRPPGPQREIPIDAEIRTVRIPRDIDALDADAQWKVRERTRAEFQQWIGEGFVVTDYDGNGTYTLTRGVLSDFAR